MGNKGRRFEAHPLHEAEAALLVQSARTPRDRAIIALLWRGGLRSNELVELDLESVRFQDDGSAQIKINRPKGVERGAPRRVVAVGKKTVDLLRAFLKRRGEQPGPFFQTRVGKRLVNQQIRRTVALAGKRAGLDRRVHPHCLRHTFAANLYDEGVGMRHLQVALGHASLATTEKYLRSIGCDEVVEILARRDW